ncbi:hypothetical protein FKM82_021819 [Ascaphus truei]
MWQMIGQCNWVRLSYCELLCYRSVACFVPDVFRVDGLPYDHKDTSACRLGVLILVLKPLIFACVQMCDMFTHNDAYQMWVSFHK